MPMPSFSVKAAELILEPLSLLYTPKGVHADEGIWMLMLKLVP